MAELVTSLKNPTVKLIRSLAERKARDETGLFFVEGVRMVSEAADANAHVETLVVAPALLTDPAATRVAQTAERLGARRLEVTPEVMLGISRRANPKGLAAVVRQRWTALEDVVLAADRFALALSEVRDPGNLGTILRTCDAVGVDAVLLIGEATDPHHPTALSASTGAIFSQPLVRTTFARFAAWKQAHGHRVVGTAPDADREYRAVSYERSLVLLMGNESLGLSAEQRAICDLLVRIPMVGRAESLNLAVATGLMLYEVFGGGVRDQGSGARGGFPLTSDL